MFSKIVLTALITLVGATSGAFASEYTPDHFSDVHSTISRADATAAALQARAGRPAQSEAQTFAALTAGGLTRAQVVAETIEAIRVGAIGRGEHNVFPTAKQLESIRLAGLKALPMTVASR